MNSRGTFHVCGISDEDAKYEMQYQSETRSREYLITRTIRMLAMLKVTKKTLLGMYDTSKKLICVEKDNRIITDDTLYHLFCEEK